ncbi:hypothetical protein [Paraflavitalea speifideaquila]|nr:hypothetical protein [Paraflavitalea speifideiaquila]
MNTLFLRMRLKTLLVVALALVLIVSWTVTRDKDALPRMVSQRS